MSRKLAPNEDENPCKRQRVSRDASIGFRASFDSLNDDCALNILSFLPIDDVNTFAMINGRCCAIRRHESVDQTRTATIICSQTNRSTVESLCAVLNTASRTLSAHYTSLKILGLGTVTGDLPDDDGILIGPLPNLTKLELAPNPNERINNTGISWQPLSVLPHCLPNLWELTLSGETLRDDAVSTCFFGRLPQLKKVKHVGGSTDLTGWWFSSTPALTDLALDECCLQYTCYDHQLGMPELLQNWFSTNDQGHEIIHILFRCLHLQRLSIKGATWCLKGEESRLESQHEPISQDMLIKMVRNHPTLRWLRSDLSEENVAMLRQERPGITFASE